MKEEEHKQEQESHNDQEKKLAEYKDTLQRLQAEFENFKKRIEKDKSQLRQFVAAEVVKNFLPVVDSFELALKTLSSKPESEQLQPPNPKITRGLELIYAQFYSVLESQGLKPIKAVGERFDPYKHEVLMQEATADEKKDGLIAEEFQKGYMLGDVVIRYSKVKVFKQQNSTHL